MITSRRHRFIGVIGAFIISSGLFAGTALAQGAGQTTTTIDPGYWTVTPFVGFGFSGDLDSATPDIGIAGGYVWSPRVSFEGEFSFLPSSENSGLVEVSTRVWNLTGNVLYHFSGRDWVPYGVAGIGFGHSSADINTSDPFLNSFDTSSTEFVANIGGGVERALRNNTALRGDFRYMFGGDLVPDFWRLSVGVTLGFHRR
ncbi:MAG: porin family protein [Acidobacteria bacterium]|nr:porin family protein [Acidobacteriota bacterium]